MKETFKALSGIPPEMAGVLMAMVIAALRVIYDPDETKPMRVFLESMICGGLSVAATAAIFALGLSPMWAVFAGSVIGFLGSMAVRTMAMNAISKRIDK